jgi:cytochrome P450 PksS
MKTLLDSSAISGFTKNRRSALTAEELRRLPWTPRIFRPLERNMLDLDLPDHTRLRSLVHKALTPSLVEQIRLRIQTVANELIDVVSSRREMDLVKDFALPMTIITGFLGVPTKPLCQIRRNTGTSIGCGFKLRKSGTASPISTTMRPI